MSYDLGYYGNRVCTVDKNDSLLAVINNHLYIILAAPCQWRSYLTVCLQDHDCVEPGVH